MSENTELHPALVNLKRNQAKLFARQLPCFIECEEMADEEGNPYQIHLKPPQGVGFDNYNEHDPVRHPFNWACNYLREVVIDPITRQRCWGMAEIEALKEAYKPVFVIKLADEAMIKLAETYPTPEQVKNSSANTEKGT